MTSSVVIVGASHGGVQVAVSLREAGFVGRIQLVDADPEFPYQRPPLSKTFMQSGADAGPLHLRSARYFERHEIEVLLASECVEILHDERRATGIRLADGSTINAEWIVLAVGAEPRLLPDSEGIQGVHYLRTFDDAKSLKGALHAAQKVVVIGGGFIGLEAASVAMALGKQVTVIEAAATLASRAAPAELGEFLRSAHERRGVQIKTDAVVVRLETSDVGEVESVCLADSSRLDADLVIVGIGVAPRTDLLTGLGLDLSSGTLVDEQGQTGMSGLLAVGDCTVAPHPMTGLPVRLESVPGAVAQGIAVARLITATDKGDAAIPWFWSDQYDLKVQMAGISGVPEKMVTRGSMADEEFAFVHYNDAGFLVGIHAVNSSSEFVAVRKALSSGIDIPPRVAEDVDINLNSYLKSAKSLR